MGFSTKQPTPETANIPIQKEQMSTNQQTVPVPWWWGRQKIALRCNYCCQDRWREIGVNRFRHHRHLLQADINQKEFPILKDELAMLNLLETVVLPAGLEVVARQFKTVPGIGNHASVQVLTKICSQLHNKYKRQDFLTMR